MNFMILCASAALATSITTPSPLLTTASPAAVVIDHLEWVGATTNLASISNWEGNYPWSAISRNAVPAQTDILGNPDGKTVVARIPANTRLNFGKLRIRNGVRIRISHGAKMVISARNTGPVATSTVGVVSQATDFMCHSNWVGITDKGARVNVTKPLCEAYTSDGVFAADETYFVTMAPGAYDQVTFDNFRFANQEIRSCLDLTHQTKNQLYLSDCASTIRFNNDTALCRSLMQVMAFGCFCHSSCASAAQQVIDDAEDKAAAANLAQDQQDVYDEIITKTFSGVITSDALGISGDELQAMMSSPGDKAQLLRAIVAALADRWGVDPSAIAVSKFDLDIDGHIAVSLAGNVTGAAIGFLNGVDANGNEIYDDLNFGLVSAWNEGDAATLAGAIRLTIQQQVILKAQEGLQTAMSAARIACDITCLKTGLDEVADAFIAMCADPVLAVNNLLDNNNINPVPKFGVSAQDISAAAQALLTALNQYRATNTPTDVQALLTYIRVVAAAFGASRASSDLSQRLPVKRTYTSPTMKIGQSLPLSYLTRLIDATNVGMFGARCAGSIDQFLGMQDIFAYNFTFYIAQKARRVASGKAIELYFSYRVLCYPDQLRADCDPLLNPTNTEKVRQRLNLVATLFRVASHNRCFTLNGGYDMVCVQSAVNAAYRVARNLPGGSNVSAALAARLTYISIMGCGLTGVAADGTCVDPTQASPAKLNFDAATAAATAALAYSPPTPQATAVKSSGLPVAAVAGGVGGGALLCILVIALLVSRRRRGTDAAARKSGPSDATSSFTGPERTVVAFENPMYDARDPKVSAYQTADNEGLYDEPAYNAVTKTNPAYQMEESLGFGNLVDGEDYDTSAYLDVIAEGQGTS